MEYIYVNHFLTPEFLMSIEGEKNPNAKLTLADVEEIKALYLAGHSQYRIAEMFGVRQPAISKVLRGERWKAAGQPPTTPREIRKLPDIVRFNRSYKAMPNGCWEWQLSKLQPPHLPYGQFKVRVDGKPYNRTAHRWIYQQINGDLPEEIHVCHRCDNPSCVNPGHLFAGPALVNVHDMYIKGRNAKRHGEAQSMAKLCEADVREIRRLSADGITQAKIADQFGITRQQVSKIALKRRWAHL